jgi:hypothetical protein
MGNSRLADWIHGRSLTLVLMGLFAVFTVGQVLTGRAQYNEERRRHQQAPLTVAEYLRTGHHWEALFENWESEFLQMGVFMVFTTRLYQQGSPESRRVGVIEHVDADPRRFRSRPGAPWPVRRGGAVLWLYERSLGIAFGLLFLISWAGHAAGGWHLAESEALDHGAQAPTLSEYVSSSAFWFESLQNWQSEFLSIAAMVWLSVYLRQRGSPESKPVHAAHHEAE